MLVLKFSRQPTDETNDGSMPGRNPRQQTPRRRKEMLKKLMAKMQNEEGQGLVEYALIIALIAIICIAGLNLLAPQINATLGAIATAITPA
jgi:pilus assembly protein Flp/PilA